jgi:hypothetical protein
LDCGEEQGDQDRNDGNHDKKFDQSEGAAIRSGHNTIPPQSEADTKVTGIL